MLLSTIENISSTHNRLKRSRDAMWKALVSAALNDKKLPAWIRIIFRTRKIVEECYSPWAYVARTGMNLEAFKVFLLHDCSARELSNISSVIQICYMSFCHSNYKFSLTGIFYLFFFVLSIFCVSQTSTKL